MNLEKFNNLFEVREARTFIKEALNKTPEAEVIRKAIFETCDSIAGLDWLYEKSRQIVDAFRQYDEATLDDNLSEIADGLVDVYNTDRTAWLAMSLDFAEYVDNARAEFGDVDSNDKTVGIFDLIGKGQYMLIEQLAHNLLAKMQAL
jgi:hypothetical protein